MVKALVIIIMLTSSVAWSEAALSIGLLDEDPNFPGECVFPEFNERVKISQIFQPEGRCALVQCTGYDQATNKLAYSYEECSPVFTNDPLCKVIKDKDAEYPGCCGQLVCQ